jgi:hypothetical protein
MPSSPFRVTRRLTAAALMALAIGAAGTANAQTAAAPAAKQAEQPLSAEARARYVGDYVVQTPDGDMPIHVYVEAEKLMARPGDDDASRLIYQGGDTFRPEMAPEATVVFTVVDGKATKFLYTPPEGNGGIEAVRKP